jgi:hypothetical protein
VGVVALVLLEAMLLIRQMLVTEALEQTFLFGLDNLR